MIQIPEYNNEFSYFFYLFKNPKQQQYKHNIFSCRFNYNDDQDYDSNVHLK